MAMAVDVLILNTAVVDFRRPDFEFADRLVGKSGLAKCPTADMPGYSQRQLAEWIRQGFAAAGGPGNAAPLIAKAGLKAAVGVNLGAGVFDGLDAQGRFFCDVMTANGVDMSQTFVHPSLPTGTTFVHDCPGDKRGGIAYFPNANNDFDFDIFRNAVSRLNPSIVYYMYSGLSDRGDANGGKDLAEFITWCRKRQILTIVDSHTLTADPQKLIASGQTVIEYTLLVPLFGELDLFFTSCDEAKLIENTLAPQRQWHKFTEDQNNRHFLEFVSERFWSRDSRTRMFGVTVSDGAWEKHICADGSAGGPYKVQSRFMQDQVIDLVGAGDSFRAGLITYIVRHLETFKNGSMNFAEAVQMGNLFASLYIKAPLDNRYAHIKPYDRMLATIRGTD